MTLVVDASVAVRWVLRMDGSDRAIALLRSEKHLIAPDLVFAEVVNTTWKFATFEGLPQELATSAVHECAKYFDEIVSSLGLKDRALAISLSLKHPAYDCFYLALAEQRECRVATMDARLLRRCAGTAFEPLILAA